MITLGLAIRAIGVVLLLLPPFFFSGIITSRLQMRRVQLHFNEIPNAARQLFGYRMGAYLCLLMFLVSLLAWAGLILAVRFNWSRDDVSEIEILVFPSPDPATRPERTISVKDERAIGRLFDGLASLQAYHPAHEHAVGTSYALRLRRRSDGQWSRYYVRVHPDKEPTSGGLRMKGVYEMSLDVGWGKLNLGSYQASELGRVVEQLVDIKDGKP